MSRPHILITPGDPAGIGPEVIAKALAHADLPQHCSFETWDIPAHFQPGKPTTESARFALDALESAAARLLDGSADAVVTGPVSKEQLQAIGFPYPGQTEFFTERLHATETAMCLTGRTLTVVLATIHISIAEVPTQLSQESIISAGKLLAAFLQKRHQRLPRIAVCGLNPHAGEHGAFGQEEITTIQPAIEQLQKLHIAEFSGPHVPDAIFRDAANQVYDGVLCMYHDQGLIPLKLLDFDNAVNITLGLPKPRLSPDHGTAFGIAGTGTADPGAMIAAIRMAGDCAMRRFGLGDD